MPTKNTTIVSARIADGTLAQIKARIARKGKTLNGWLNWAIKQGLRPHKKRQEE